MKTYGWIFAWIWTAPVWGQLNTNQFGTNQIEGGNQIAVGAYTEYENHPYLLEDWSKGYLKATTGKWYAAEKLNYNVSTNQPEFQQGEKRFSPKLDLAAFTLGDTASGVYFQNGFPAIDQQTAKSFYQVLSKGSVKLLKYTKATLLDVTSFNSATKKKRFDFNETYYVYRPDQKIIRVKKDKKSVLEALPEQATRIEEIAGQRKLRLKNWEEIRQVLAEL